ncbi:MAG: endo alpha-1,4 polygalactosaminidase [Deltaproteobacteria bacterium]|nr:endo alpha-1,4 polygalactosaminidase [Deltaproteobacteria bacterium]
MRTRSLLFVALIGCGGGGTPSSPDGASAADAAPPDAAPAPWWQPHPGDARNWDIQLAAPFELSAPRTMYTLGLWDVVPSATTLDYGDGAPVTVPAGALADAIATLHATTPRTVVICRVDTGAWEATRPDAGKFPGAGANPPDRPTPPATGSVIGWSASRPDERFLDIRPASRDQWAPIIWKRLDLAAQIGCDGVMPDRNDMITSDPGFTLELVDQESWFREVAAHAHDRNLSVGMKNGNTIPGLVEALTPDFDWIVIERCGEYQDCDSARSFVNARKAALAIDYLPDADGGGVAAAIACPRQMTDQIQDGIVKDPEVTSLARTQCTP